MAERYSFHLTEPLPPERSDELTQILLRADELIQAMAWPTMPPVIREAKTPSGAYRLIGTLTVGSSILYEVAGLDVKPLLQEVLKTLSIEFQLNWTLNRDGGRVGYVSGGVWRKSEEKPEDIPFAAEKPKKGCGRNAAAILLLLFFAVLIGFIMF
ncbi:MAG: hypothetical protein ACYS8W_11535 [Planctomycetota bacterium]|jgi:hypothetical protein